MIENRNTILAVILSGIVLIAWQYFYNVPQMEKQRAQTQTQAELAKPAAQATPGSTTPSATPSANAPANAPAAGAAAVVSRDAAIALLHERTREHRFVEHDVLRAPAFLRFVHREVRIAHHLIAVVVV